ncbi:MAG: radical SAM protein [Firmicutes bacterium]|nr:radical SAM protein [Bacillota bacterium]
MRLLVADEEGRISVDEELACAGRTGDILVEVQPADVIPMPPGATLMFLPGREAIGVDVRSGEFTMAGHGLNAVSAILPQGYTRTLLPAYTTCGPWAGGRYARGRYARGGRVAHASGGHTGGVRHQILPLFGYTMVGMGDDGLVVAAVQTDEDFKWSPDNYNTGDLPDRVAAVLEELPGNRILRQLSKCALEYGCFTAQNIFYRRWEGGIPVAEACNARCLGCISIQPSECCPAPQERIRFTPSVAEIVEVALPHLEEAEDAIISFGQGCEGEPLTRSELLVEAVRSLRQATGRGTININTNAGDTRGFKALCEAGLDSARVSLISARPEMYDSYHRPHGYSLEDVIASLKIAKGYGVFTSVNLLAFPGVTDREKDIEALAGLIGATGLDMIQLRNLNIDPDFFIEVVRRSGAGASGEGEVIGGEAIGMVNFIEALKSSFPSLEIGSYSRPVRP